MTTDCESRNVVVRIGTDAPVEIPVVDSTTTDEPAVKVQQRTDGIASIQMIADVQVPAVWRGEDIFDKLPFGRNDETVALTIDAKNDIDGPRDYENIFSGWVKKIGSGGEGRLLRIRAVDYASLLNAQPFGRTYYGDSIDMQELLNDVKGVANRNIALQTLNVPSVDGSIEIDNGKKFDPKEATLARVINWVSKKLGKEWYIDYDNQFELRFFTPPLNLYQTTDVAGYSRRESQDVALGRDVLRVQKNQALYEINPVNAVTVIGQAYDSADNKYIIGRAEHDDLVARAGGRVNDKLIYTDSSSALSAKNRAIKELRDILSGANEGTIRFFGEKALTPHCAFVAYPVCDDLVQTNIRAIDYDTKRVTHKIPARGKYMTEASVGIPLQFDNLTTRYGIGSSKGELESRSNNFRESGGEVNVDDTDGTASVNL